LSFISEFLIEYDKVPPDHHPGKMARTHRFSRPRRKPRRTARRRKGLVPRRVLRKPRRIARRIKSNLEVKTQVHDIRVDELQYNVGSELGGPANSVCLLAGLFGGDNATASLVSTGLLPGTGCDNIIGCWSTPAFPTSMKLDISYKELDIVDGYSAPNPNLRVIHGFYMNTGDKMNAGLGNTATWIANIRSALLRELFDSDYSADYLMYTQKSRNIKVLSDRLIRPKRSNQLQVPADATSTSIVSPNSQLRYKWPHSKMKTRLQPTIDSMVPPNPRMVPNNAWIPFLLLLAPGLSNLQTGHLRIRSVTKAYFHDA